MLQLPETLLHSTAAACLNDMLRGLRAEPSASITVDASALVRFDSTALAVLLELRRVAMAAGKALVLQAVPSRLLDLARLYGIDGLLTAQGDVAPVK
jgi:phospholipid transport system transporter-binding protein